MPYAWIDPEEFLPADLTGGLSVCYCYTQGCVMQYHYQFQNDESNTGWTAFDIRDLAYAVRQHPRLGKLNGAVLIVDSQLSVERKQHQTVMITAALLGGEGGLLAFLKETDVDLYDQEDS